MAFVVSKSKEWDIESNYVKVPIDLIRCSYLTPNAKLILIALMNQVGWPPVWHSALDELLGIHRSTRIRCINELKELGFISGTDSHYLLNDPIIALQKLIKDQIKTKEEVVKVLSSEEYLDMVEKGASQDKEQSKRDYIQEATDAWNMFRPKDYQKIRRISAPLIKAIDIHMKDLGIKAHDYNQFFSVLKSGISKSAFWSTQNSSKTLQSITGIGTPTDKKRSNVYSLFNEGIDKPAEAVDEEDRSDTIVYPAKYRKIIDEYEAAQYTYNEQYRNNRVTPELDDYVIRTEQALKDAGLDPIKFRFKYGMKTWPTDTPEPEASRVVNWTYDDEYDNAY